MAAAAVPKPQPVRGPLPEHLPREVHRHEPKEQSCPDCGGTLRKLGEDVSEMLESTSCLVSLASRAPARLG